jgi:hypothetical protein
MHRTKKNGRHRQARRITRRMILAGASLATIAASLMLWAALAQASTHPLRNNGYPIPDRAACAREGNARPMRVHVIGSSGLTWQYVTAGEARELRISPCSIVIVGEQQSVVMAPGARIAARS